MDALKFIQELQRMCKSYYHEEKGYCSDACPAKNLDCMSLDQPEENIKRIVEVVKSWSKDNPKKTRQDLFLEQHSEANIENGVVDLCPVISGVYEDSKGYCKNPDRSCGFCRREFWLKEVE